MPEQEPNALSNRLDNVEMTLQRLTQRVFDLEKAAGAQPKVRKATYYVPTAPPPVRTPSNWQTAPTVKETPTTESNDHLQAQPDDLEYKIGLTGLLRGGAAVIVIAIIYLVALAVSRGYITPQVQFIGEIILCAAFIAIGFVKRDEREEFGQLMVGIGSCGLYLSFAGAHLYKHLYEGETLVGLFLALSFANLAFAWWRSSRSFLGIGMIGGLTAAMMPMHKYNPTLDVILHFVILVPTALIVVKNRWMEMAGVLWAASTAALVPALTYDSVWMVRIGALYGSSLICAAAYGVVWRKTDFDPNYFLSVAMIVLAGIGALGFDSVDHGSLHVLLLAAAAGAIGWALRSNEHARNSLWMGGLTVAVALFPVGFHRLEAGITFAILSVVLSIVSLRFYSKALTVLAGVELALGLCAYTAPWIDKPVHFSLAAESGLILALAGATFSSAFAACKVTALAGKNDNSYVIGFAGLLVGIFVDRLSVLWLGLPALGVGQTAAFAIGMLVVAGISAILASKRHWFGLVPVGWIAAAIASVTVLSIHEFQNPTLGFELSMLTGALLGVMLVANATAKFTRDTVWLTGWATTLAWVLFSRLGFLLLTCHFIGLKQDPALTITWTAFAICLIALGFHFRAQLLRYWSFVVFGATLVKVFLYDLSSLDPAIRVGVLMLLGVGMLSAGYWGYIRHRPAGLNRPQGDL